MENLHQSSRRKRKVVSYTQEDSSYSGWEDNTPAKKPKNSTSAYAGVEIIDLTGDSPKNSPKKTPKTPNKRSGKIPYGGTKVDENKRLKRFRDHAPQSYLEIKARALTQRFTVLHRERCGTDELPEEKIVMAGSTGNVYTQKIGLVPSCDCPHAKKGNQCKHIIYVMLRVLKAPEHIGYQLALTPTELRSLLANSVPIPTADASAESSDGNRKPIEGECPICYCEFADAEKNNIAYCKAACGNNVHKGCMASWTSAKNGRATCPYCRAVWVDDTLTGKVDLKGATRTEEGYLNVAEQLGLSGQRDYSSYYHPHVNRSRGYGYAGARGGYGYEY